MDRVGDLVQRFKSLLCRGGVITGQRERLETRLAVFLVVVLVILLAEIFAEMIGAKPCSERQLRRQLRRVQRAADGRVDKDGGALGAARIEMGDNRAADALRANGIEFLRRAEADEDHAVEFAARGRKDAQRLVLFALETARCHGAPQLPARPFVEIRRTGAERSIVEDADNEDPLFGNGGRGEGDFHSSSFFLTGFRRRPASRRRENANRT